MHTLTAFCVFKHTKYGNKKFTIAVHCVFKYTNINYHDTQKLCIFLEILNIASVLDNYIIYFQKKKKKITKKKKKKIIRIPQVF